MAPDCGQYRSVFDSERFARQLGSETRVQDDRIAAFEGINRQPARLAFGDEPLRAVEAREIVQHPGEPSSGWVQGVSLGEPICKARDPHRMRVALRLPKMRAHPAP